MILWGRSFGGYLAPRSGAVINQRSRLAAIVADGGIYDFYQSTLCKLPPSAIADFEVGNDTAVDSLIAHLRSFVLSLDFMLNFGYLGFNVTSPSAFFYALQDYTMDDNMMNMLTCPIFVHNPAMDTVTGNASAIFYAQLPISVRNAQSTLFTEDPLRGASLHCSIGSSANGILAILRWLRTLNITDP